MSQHGRYYTRQYPPAVFATAKNQKADYNEPDYSSRAAFISHS